MYFETASMICLVLMFIGGSPVGTAGGIKTISVVSLLAVAIASIRNKKDVVLFDNGKNVAMDRALYSRYNLDIEYEDVYIDFDDTITLRNQVNPLTMFFLYQCRNKGKKVFLLTRHIDDIYNSCKKYAISEDLFSEIIHIKDNTKKSAYIKSKKSIFIDNMFKERLDVKDSCGIPVFDADGFEFLLDWRL